jgi:hypothetical protein
VRLPHRFPFRFVERGDQGTARVLLSANDFWSRGTVPRGAGLWIETMAQAAALTLTEPDSDEHPDERVLAGVENLTLDREPAAGVAVTISLRLEARFGAVARVAATAADDEGPFARATLVLVRR